MRSVVVVVVDEGAEHALEMASVQEPVEAFHACGADEQAGGPFQYTGKELGDAHKDFHITSEEFDEVGAEIGRALDHFNVPEPEKQEVSAAIVARKTEVVNPLAVRL